MQEAWRNPWAMAAGMLSAIAVPSLLFVAYVHALAPEAFEDGSGRVIVGMALVYTTAHVLLFGVPAVILLAQRGAFKAMPVAAAGLLAGALPYGTVALLAGSAVDWNLAKQTLIFGVLGLAGAMAFYGVYRLVDRVRVAVR